MQTQPVKSIAVILAVAGFIGPLMLAIGVLVLGGDLLDGFAGSRSTNTPAQNFFVDGGGFVTLAVAGIGCVIGLIIAIRLRRSDRGSFLLPLCPLMGVACGLVALAISNAF